MVNKYFSVTVTPDVIMGDIDLGEFEISFISTIFGAMSAKVNTVVDFFFGGSSKKNEQQNK